MRTTLWDNGFINNPYKSVGSQQAQQKPFKTPRLDPQRLSQGSKLTTKRWEDVWGFKLQRPNEDMLHPRSITRAPDVFYLLETGVSHAASDFCNPPFPNASARLMQHFCRKYFRSHTLFRRAPELFQSTWDTRPCHGIRDEHGQRMGKADWEISGTQRNITFISEWRYSLCRGEANDLPCRRITWERPEEVNHRVLRLECK